MKRLMHVFMLLFLVLWGTAVMGQSGCATGDCNDNTYLNSMYFTDRSTVAYDNMVSTFHSSIVRESDGTIKAWGQGIGHTGLANNPATGAPIHTGNVLRPQEISVANGYDFTGNILHFTGGSRVEGSQQQQFALLTTTGLYIWGIPGTLVSTDIKNNNAFGSVTIGGQSNGLPAGVNPTDVKMLFGSTRTLVIITCTGDVWVLSSQGAKNGDGTNTDTGTSWTQVTKSSDSQPLTDVVAVRGTPNALMALTATGDIYTWGTGTYLGTGAAASRTRATLMTLPTGLNKSNIKMIGMTQSSTNQTYYLLDYEGNLYSLGNNTQRQLGNSSTTASTSWVRPQKPTGLGGGDFDNVAWISPNEHDDYGQAAINVITKQGKLVAWGSNNGLMIGGETNNANYNPILMPGGLDANDVIIATETGGHTTVSIKQCSQNYGYVGHKISGSMGDGTSATGNENVYSFATAVLIICGAPAAPIVEDLEICPNETADLSSAVVGSTPNLMELEWYPDDNGAPGTTKLTNTNVGVGIYWAVYKPKVEGNCTPPPSARVTVKIADKGCSTDIAITKEVDNATPIPGENVIFTLTVQNLGTTATGGDATNITVTDALPSGYTFVSANPSAAYNAGTGVWTIGDLAGGVTRDLKITATVSTNSTANFTNTATVNVPDNTDTNPDNNTDEETTSPVFNTTHAVDDINTTYIDLPVSGNVLTNDYDVEGHGQTISTTPVTAPANGSISLNTDGTYTYTPNADFTGTDNFTYQVCDDATPTACTTAIVTIQVIPFPAQGENNVVANNDHNRTKGGTAVTGNVIDNDFDPEGDNMTATKLTDPTSGNVTLNPDGTYEYTPNPGFEGTDTFTYTLCDDGTPEACEVATVTIIVGPATENITVANDDVYYMSPGTTISKDVKVNDFEPEGDSRTFTLEGSTTPNGTLVFNPDGTFNYTPDPSFLGTDRFVYKVCDDGTPAACDFATVYLVTEPKGSMELLKSGAYVDTNTDTEVNVGDHINYTFTLENTGNVTIDEVSLEDPLFAASNPFVVPVLASGDANSNGKLDVGETWTYRALYAITQTDIDNGGVWNLAVAKGKDPKGGDVEDESEDPEPLEPGDPGYDEDCADCTFTELPQSPSMELLKSGAYVDTNTDTEVNVGDHINYTFILENTGNVTIDEVSLDDPLFAAPNPVVVPVLASGDTNDDGKLDVGETWTYTALYAITQTDIDAGGVWNLAIAKGKDPKGGDVTDESEDPEPLEPGDPGYDEDCVDCTFTDLPQSPSMELLKSGAYVDTNTDTEVNVGDHINYTFTLENTGNVTIDEVSLADPLFAAPNPVVVPVLASGDANDDGKLDVGETWTYTAVYAITQTDIDNGGVWNLAIAKGKDPKGGDVEDESEDPAPLEPGDPGYDEDCADCTFTELPQSPSMELLKSGAYVDTNTDTEVNVGDHINYTFTLENTGNVTIDEVSLEDPLFAAPNPVVVPVLASGDANDDGKLDVGETWTYTAVYAITQTDIDNGGVWNLAIAKGKDPKGGDVEDESEDPAPLEPGNPGYDEDCVDCTFTDLPQSPSMELLKGGAYVDTNTDTEVNVGDHINYTFTLENTGNVTIDEVSLDDPLFAAPNPVVVPVLASGDTNDDGKLDVGETWTYTATYAITQTDIDNGGVWNLAIAKGKDPKGGDVEDESEDPAPLETGDPGYDEDCVDCTFTELPQNGGLEVIKTTDRSQTYSKVGDVITYSIKVTNVGNVTLTNVEVTDDNADDVAVGTIASLVPNASETFTAEHTVTQADLDAGAVYNIATAKGKDPKGGDVEDDSEDDNPMDPNDPNYPGIDPDCEDCTITLIDQAGELEVIKTTDRSQTYSKVGDVITYSIKVTNVGNVTLTNVNVTDDNADDTQVGTIASLAPGASESFTAEHTVTQADLDAGAVYNIATAKGKDPKGGDVEDDSEDDNPMDPNDPNYPGIDPDCEDCTITVIDQAGELEVIKTTDRTQAYSKVGDVITYTIKVTNVGNVTLTNVNVTDDNADDTQVGTIASLAPGVSESFTAEHTVTQADLDAGAVYNIATAKGKDPKGGDVEDDSEDDNPMDPNDPNYPGIDPDCEDCTITVIDQAGELEVIKTTDRSQTYSKVGDVITYSIKVTNVGNVTLTNVEVTDDNADDTQVGTIASLAPGASESFTAEHTVTQADLDAGAVYNIATAKGKDPKGGDVEDDSEDDNPMDPNDPDYPGIDPDCEDCTIVIIDQAGELEVIKTTDRTQSYSKVGDVITYTIKVTNVGNVTLTNVNVTDDNADDTVVGTIASLAPNASETFTAEHTVTQGDLDAGSVYNIAKAKGRDPKNRGVEDDSEDDNPLDPNDPNHPGVDPDCETCTIVMIDQEGKLQVIKTALLNEIYRYVGDKIEYDIVVRNVGNVTLNNVVVTDENADNNEIGIIDVLAVGDSKTFKAYHTVTAADMERGYVANIALAKGKDPKGKDVEDESESGNTPEPEDPTDPTCEDCTITPLPWKKIEADDDSSTPINGYEGGEYPTVLENDKVNGKKVNPDEVNLTPGTSPLVGKISMNPDGSITVAPQTPAGTYRYPYTICEVRNPDNCDDAVATIVVTPALIEAENDKPEPINGVNGGETPSVFENDQLNKGEVKPEEVTLIWLDEEPDGLTLNPNGSVTVAAGTPAGTHQIHYRICEVLNPSNCSEAIITVVVAPAPIQATDDPLKVEWSRELGTTSSVLTNDQFNNGSIDLDKIRLTPGTPSNLGLIMNPDGTITIAPSTRPGTYEYPYTICEVLNPTNCSTAIATVVVEINKLFIPNVFTPNGDGTNDTFELIGMENYDRVSLIVINRWGNEVYRNDNYRNEWNGANLNEGTYYYIITMHKGGSSEILKGWVLIKKQ